jgi:hypothetical protein
MADPMPVHTSEQVADRARDLWTALFRRSKAATVIALLFGSLFICTVFRPTQPLAQDGWGTSSERNVRLCHYKARCAEYATARQACATAGNFDTCMGIKLNGGYSLLKNMCSGDGNFAIPINDMPGDFSCRLWRAWGVVSSMFGN